MIYESQNQQPAVNVFPNGGNGNFGGDGFGNNGAWWIIILFLFAMMGGWGNNGNNLIALENGLNYLEYLSFIHNSAKGTAYQTLSACNAFILIDNCPALLVGNDSIHAASGLTGALHMHNSIIRTRLSAFSATDTLI